jgi:hypothetical protein
LKITNFLGKIPNNSSTLLYSFESSPLQWNRFKLINEIFLQYQLVITTNSTSQIHLNMVSVEKCEKMLKLKEMGLNSVEISNYLNSNGIQTPTGKSYSPKLVWVTLSKYEKRLLRDKHSTLQLVSECWGVE